MNGAAAGHVELAGRLRPGQRGHALNAVDLLRVATTSPANGSTVTSAPSVIQVTFNKPVVFSTPLRRRPDVHLGPGGRDGHRRARRSPSTTRPTRRSSTSRSASPRRPASWPTASYTFTIQSPASGTGRSEDGKDLVASGPITFTLADVTAPTIINTDGQRPDRHDHVQRGDRPDHGHAGNIFVLRKGSAAAWPPNAGGPLGDYINLNNDPRTTISYNPLTFTVTLDYSNLPQTELPSDNYAIVVLSPTTAGAAGRHRPGRQPARRLLHRLVPDHGLPGQALRLHPEPGLRRRCRRPRSRRSR